MKTQAEIELLLRGMAVWQMEAIHERDQEEMKNYLLHRWALRWVLELPTETETEAIWRKSCETALEIGARLDVDVMSEAYSRLKKAKQNARYN